MEKLTKSTKRTDVKRFSSIRTLSISDKIARISLDSTRSLPWTPQKNDHITPGPEINWTHVGTAKDVLFKELQKLYWDGVGRELGYALQVMHKMQGEVDALEVFDAEEDGFIHGFDTFIDHVCTNPEQQTKTERSGSIFGRNKPKPYLDTLKSRVVDLQSELPRKHIKASTRARVAFRTQVPVLHKLARMILQSQSFLDIDKVIEHRPQSHGKKSQTPQLVFESLDKNLMPKCETLKCSRCIKSIRGSFFRSISEVENEILCESCYRSFHMNDGRFYKVYKYCILQDIIRPENEKQICGCHLFNIKDQTSAQDGRIFPIGPEEGHAEKPSVFSQKKCGFYRVRENLETQISQNSPESSRHERKSSKPQEDHSHMAIRFGPLMFEIGVEQ